MRRRGSVALVAVVAAAVAAVPALGAPAVVTTFAGTTRGFSGDDGPATGARLDGPGGTAVLADGSVVIADVNNNAVRRVTSSGVMGTAAGTGAEGSSGDGGLARLALLRAPRDVAALPGGGYLVADTGNHRIRRVGPDGVITTVAGSEAGLGGDGGPATAARLRSPSAVAVLPDGGYLVADTGNHRIRRVTPGGAITTVAGSEAGLGGDGGPAAGARLSAPQGVAVAPDGSVLIADTGNGRIRRVTPSGVISTVAGPGAGFAVEGGVVAPLALAAPSDVLPLADGGLLVADAGSDRVRRVTPLGAMVTVAGGRRGLAGDGGAGTSALLDTPTALTAAPGGAFLVGDTGNNRVRRLSGSGDLPAPSAFQTVGVAPVSGAVTVRPGRRAPAFLPLAAADLAPNVSEVDALRGTLDLVVAGESGGTSDARVSQGRFRLVQPLTGTATAELQLNQVLDCRPAPARAGAAEAQRRPRTRRLRLRVRGRYMTRGRYASATASGTAWTIVDGCDRTVIRVTEGRVRVFDAVRNRTVTVRAGRTFVVLRRRS